MNPSKIFVLWLTVLLIVNQVALAQYDFAGSTTQVIFDSKLLPQPGGISGAGDRLGTSLALSGDRAVVGANNMFGTGAVVVYERNGLNWLQVAVIEPADGETGDDFGQAVSLDGDRIMVGAPGDDGAKLISGSVYVFEFDGSHWLEIDKITANDESIGAKFGTSVSLQADRVLIGSIGGQDSNESATGAAYVFDFDGMVWNQTEKLLANNGQANDQFGYSVSLMGDTALVGARNDVNSNGALAGSVYVFDHGGNGWTQSQVILAPDGSADDSFGESISTEANKMMIGASNVFENGQYGAVYFYQKIGSTWEFGQKLYGSHGGGVGTSIHLSGDQALMGASRESTNGPQAGAAYLFEFNGVSWIESQFLLANQGDGSDYFGSAVGLSGDWMIIGAFSDDENGDGAGAAYSFNLQDQDWTEIQKLLPQAGAIDDEFGNAISLNGNQVLVAASYDDVNGRNSGAVYYYEHDGIGWNLIQKLLPDDGDALDYFGNSIDFAGNQAFIGASYESSNGFRSGAVYVFEFNGSEWVQTQKLKLEDPDSNDLFGAHVQIHQNRAVISVPGDDDNGVNAGAVIVYEWIDSSWQSVAKIMTTDGSALSSMTSIYEDRILINADNQNAVFVFEYDTENWVQLGTLEPINPVTSNTFGLAIELVGDRAVIGDPHDEENGINAGAAYVFDYAGNQWTQTQKLVSKDISAYTYFGSSVSLTQNQIIVGARQVAIVSQEPGAAYVFEPEQNVWLETHKIMALDGNKDDQYGQAVESNQGWLMIAANKDDDHGKNSGSVYTYRMYDPELDLIFSHGFDD